MIDALKAIGLVLVAIFAIALSFIVGALMMAGVVFIKFVAVGVASVLGIYLLIREYVHYKRG